MNIKIFMASASSVAEKEILHAFAQGIQRWIENEYDDNFKRVDATRIGRWANFQNRPPHTLEFEYQESYQHCDLAVMFGSWKPREKGTHMTRNSVALNAEKFFVIETPLLHRKTSEENKSWRVGLNGYLNRDGIWPILTSAAASKKLDSMGISWSGWNPSSDGHILLALQLPGDASLRGTDINEWAFRTVQRIRQHTDRKIVIRNHPLCSSRAFADHGELSLKLLHTGVTNLQFSDGAVVPWSQDLSNAWCTVTYTSGLAVDSVMAGIPTIACDEGNFAWGISSNTLDEIENPRQATGDQIHQWLQFLAGCQWTMDEMRNGVAWKYLHHLLETLGH